MNKRKIDILKIGNKNKPWVLCKYNKMTPRKWFFFFEKTFRTSKEASLWCIKHNYEITAIF